VTRIQRLFTNRDDEIALFMRMVRREIPQRILAIEAGPGYGKSWLLDRLAAECRKAGAPCARFDFDATREGETLSPVLILEKASEPLGLLPPSDLEAFGRLLRELTPGPASVQVGAGATISGSRFGDIANLIIEELHVTIPGLDPPAQRRQATRRFRDALAACTGPAPAVWLMDTCERADQNPETADWLRGAILPHVACEEALPLVIVLAGRTIPLLHPDWEDCVHRLALTPFDERQTHTLVCERMGQVLTRETVTFIHRVSAGIPKTMVELVEIYARSSAEAVR
jgi:hypothetical protein